MGMAKDFYTTHEISRFCNVYPTTVINWIKDGLLPAYTTPGGHRRIKKIDLVKLMKKNNMPVPDELAKSGKNKVLVIDDDPKIPKKNPEVLIQLPSQTSGYQKTHGFFLTTEICFAIK